MKEVPEYIFKLSPSIAFSISKAMRFLLIGVLFFIGAFWLNWLVLGSILSFGIAWYQFLYNQNICYYLTQEEMSGNYTDYLVTFTDPIEFQ